VSGNLKASEEITAAVLGAGLKATARDLREAMHAAEMRDATTATDAEPNGAHHEEG
jgi:hypothetical protein